VETYLKELGVDVRIVLIAILRKWQRRACAGLCGSEYGLVLGFCEHGNEPSCYVICDDFFLLPQ
jgi:hypothetical protein